MEDDRVALFTVKDAEKTTILFGLFSLIIIFLVYTYGVLADGWLHSILNVCSNITNIVSASTLFVIFEEGADMLFFRRYREARKREREMMEDLSKRIRKIESHINKESDDNSSGNSEPNTKSKSKKHS